MQLPPISAYFDYFTNNIKEVNEDHKKLFDEYMHENHIVALRGSYSPTDEKAGNSYYRPLKKSVKGGKKMAASLSMRIICSR